MTARTTHARVIITALIRSGRRLVSAYFMVCCDTDEVVTQRPVTAPHAPTTVGGSITASAR